MTRRNVKAYGAYGYTVNVYLDRGRVWCEWRDATGKRHTKSWPVSEAAAAHRYAEAYAAERQRLRPIIGPIPTVAQLWDKYQAAKGHAWRPKTRVLYDGWATALAAAITKEVDVLTHEDADAFRDAARARGIAHGSIRRTVAFLRQMLNFAQGRQLVGLNPLATYRYLTPKDERGAPPAEYTRDELLRIAAVLDWPEQWRPRNVIRLCASYGARVNAVLHLRWDDVSFEAETVTFQGRWDKGGEGFVRPMTGLAKTALLEASQHQQQSGWVFWSRYRPAQPMHYNSLHWHLRLAEQRAGVPHLKGRAFHGLRRLVIGDIGDLTTAAAWVRQKTLAVTASYVRERPEQLTEARRRLEAREANGN